jgi:aminoglycoside phosphotransferase (APT) family kinase protein
MQRGTWLGLPASDPVGEHLAATQWPGGERSPVWETARLSHAAYAYRERGSGWTVTAKFYAAKVGSRAAHYAQRELENIQQALGCGLESGDHRAVQPFTTWRGILFQEHVEGLTLENTLAVRKSQPGMLVARLEGAAGLLATLHAHSIQAEEMPVFAPSVRYGSKVIENLAKHGVLQDDPIASDGLRRLVTTWAECPQMVEFAPTLLHGDATTSNFVFPWSGGTVAVDWEQLHVGDPASDLGRLMAEVSHSTSRHGGDVEEGEAFLLELVDAYCRALPPTWDAGAIVERARFFRATSTLRIARNGWLSRLERTGLVVQAMALLI